MFSSRLPLLLLAAVAVCWCSTQVAAVRHKRANCGQGKFECKNGECINVQTICDGVNDCTDNSDESQEACISTYVPALTNFISNRVLASTTPCPAGKFQCDSGDCIDSANKCNGKEDCQDGSDERQPECPGTLPKTCSPNQFKCSSGACIAKAVLCDGVNDCNDGSDESENLCSRNSNLQQFCTYPPKPTNGQYKIEGCESCVPVPGQKATQQFTVIKYSCDAGYKISGDSILFCTSRGKWSYNLPTCVPNTCNPFQSPTVEAECTLNRRRVSCEQPVPPNTLAKIRCKKYFISVSISTYQNLVCGLNGEWSDIVMRCKPACGRDRAEGGTLISDGKVAVYGDFPWHIGIYRLEDNEYSQVCGGSMISTKYVLTAAHCFWNNLKKAPNPESEYEMIAGKLNRSYSSVDPEQQVRKVQKIDVIEYYSGPQNFYRDDIAVATVAEPFEISAAVQPVCVDWDDVYYLQQNSIGKVAGWGVTETGIPSETLLFAELPYIPYSDCIRFVRPGFRQYFSKDTICAGRRDGTNVCKGDSGGGLCFLQDTNPEGLSTKLYFVQGIVSVGDTTSAGDCALKSFVAFTRVSKYLQFLSNYREY